MKLKFWVNLGNVFRIAIFFIYLWVSSVTFLDSQFIQLSTDTKAKYILNNCSTSGYSYVD